MTDAQLLSISVTVLAILAGSLYNNARIGDLAGRFGDISNRFGDISNRFADVNRRTDDMANLIRAEMHAMHAEINVQFERTNNKIDALLKLVANIDQRVTSLESRKS